MERNLTAWDTHDWINSDPEGLPDQRIVYSLCGACGRGFFDEFPSGERYAVHDSVFRFHRLSDQVTSRWLSERCPGKHLIADEADRRTRVFDGSSLRLSTR
jgi:hypothetical protein